MGVCEEAPNEYCGFMLEPNDVGIDGGIVDDTWHRGVEMPAVSANRSTTC